MTDMLAKMARAIYDYAFRADCWVDAPECLDLTSVEIEGNMNLIEAVRSALQAIREPDDHVLVIGADAAFDCYGGYDEATQRHMKMMAHYGNKTTVARAFPAMIDAILQGGGDASTNAEGISGTEMDPNTPPDTAGEP